MNIERPQQSQATESCTMRVISTILRIALEIVAVVTAFGFPYTGFTSKVTAQWYVHGLGSSVFEHVHLKLQPLSF